MGQTSTGVTWPVRAHPGACMHGMTVVMSLVGCNRHLWTTGYGLHSISVMYVDHAHRE